MLRAYGYRPQGTSESELNCCRPKKQLSVVGHAGLPLQEAEGARRAVRLQNGEALLEALDLRLALCLALGVGHDAALALRLQLLDVLLNRTLLLLRHLLVLTAVLEAHVQGLDLRLRAFDLRLLRCLGDLVLLHELLVGLQSLS